MAFFFCAMSRTSSRHSSLPPTKPALWGKEAQRNERAFGIRTEARDMKLVPTQGRSSRSPVLQEIIYFSSRTSKTQKPQRFLGFLFVATSLLDANLVQILNLMIIVVLQSRLKLAKIILLDEFDFVLFNSTHFHASVVQFLFFKR